MYNCGIQLLVRVLCLYIHSIDHQWKGLPTQTFLRKYLLGTEISQTSIEIEAYMITSSNGNISVFKIWSETCKTKAQFCQNIYIVKNERKLAGLTQVLPVRVRIPLLILKTDPLWREPPVTGGLPSQRPVMQSFDVFFDLGLNKWLSKQLRHWWLHSPLCSLWCHCNEMNNCIHIKEWNMITWYRKLWIQWPHNDVLTWKHCPYYWPFVRGIQQLKLEHDWVIISHRQLWM